MAVPEFVLEKLQNYIDNWTKGLQELIDSIAGAETDNENVPMYISDNLYCTSVIYTYQDEVFSTGNAAFMLYTMDISVHNNLLTSSVEPFGKCDFDARWSSMTEEDRTSTENSLNAYVPEHLTAEQDHEGDLRVTYYTSSAEISVVYGDPPVEHTADVYRQLVKSNSQIVKNNGLTVIFNSIGYSVDSNGYISIVPSSDMWNLYISEYACRCVKGYPVILTSNNTTFINNYISGNGAANNYTGTYTTPGGETITYYYGDNYIIINPSGDMSYDDVKNVLDVSVNKINEDNDGDIKVPTYRENKYGPDPDDDIEVSMDLSDAAFGEGLSHYYVTTVGSTVLNDISAAMSTWDITNTGKDLYRNLLSCRITKVGPIPSEPSTFVIYGEELQYNGSPITITKINGNPSMDLGEYEILPKFNDFRDYAPFTKIEMFIPYCGWVSLPSHCMSSEDKPKIITGTLLCDIIAGTCKAVIKCNDTVVAEASGFTAIDVPFTGENVGMKMAGIASSITSYGNQAAKTVGSVASGAMTGGAGAGAALAGGLVGMLGSYAQMYSAFNANYTEICGKTGDGCNVAGLNKVYIKIQRPKTGGTEAPYYVPANYAHTTGFMSMKQKQISECDGFIVCANVDTSGISGATARERAEIKRLLETGIYVNLTPPEPPEP